MAIHFEDITNAGWYVSVQKAPQAMETPLELVPTVQLQTLSIQIFIDIALRFVFYGVVVVRGQQLLRHRQDGTLLRVQKSPIGCRGVPCRLEKGMKCLIDLFADHVSHQNGVRTQAEIQPRTSLFLLVRVCL